MSTLNVALPVAGALVAAGIAAGAALYSKRLERSNAAELRHSEARERAYEVFLAACDRSWHFRIKKSVDEYHGRDSVSDEEFERIKQAINEQAAGSLQDLQRHSRNYKNAIPILLRLYESAFEGRFPRPAEFEMARVAIQELQREEAGLRGQLGLIQKASRIESFKMRRQIRKKLQNVTTNYAVNDEGELDVIIHQGDGEGILYLLQENMRQWDELDESINRQEIRAIRWKSMGLWVE
jgi:hypothetical protein